MARPSLKKRVRTVAWALRAHEWKIAALYALYPWIEEATLVVRPVDEEG